MATISPLVRPRVNLTIFFFEQISQGKVFDEVLYRKESHSKLENIDLCCSRCLIGKIGQGKFNYHTHRGWYRHITPPLQLVTIHSLFQGHLGERSTSTKEQRQDEIEKCSVMMAIAIVVLFFIFHLLDTWRRYPETNQSSDG